MKRPFFTSGACRSHGHCGTCRDRDGGRAWRDAIRSNVTDIAEVDFACPEGLPWGHVPLPILDARPVYEIPDDTTPEIERARARQGGCCGPPVV